MNALALLPCLVLLGCAVHYPPGWPVREEAAQRIEAANGVPYAKVPTRWLLPGHEAIRIDVERATVVSGGGAYEADIRFVAAYADDPEPGLECTTEPKGPGVPRTRFGCWSRADPAALRFWLAPGVDCPARHIDALQTMLRPQCWQGELLLGERQLRLWHASLRSTGSPVGYVSWVDEQEQPLLAADIVRDGQFRVYDVAASPPAPALRRWLVLLTVALAWWEHAASPD